jgi:hypothetical protein
MKRRRNPRGEYWIESGGSAQFADGDIGDINHAAMVISYLCSEFLGYFNVEPDHHGEHCGTLNQYEDQIKTEIMDSTTFASDEDQEKFEETFDSDPAETMLAWLESQGIQKKYQESKDQWHDAFFMAYGSSTRSDPRDYALKHWGWVRVQGHNVQVQTLTTDSLKTIASGLGDILDQEGEYEDEGEEQLFNIEVMSTKKYYTDVPLSVIEGKDPGALRVYA